MTLINKSFIKTFVSILRSHTTTPVVPSLILIHGNFKKKHLQIDPKKDGFSKQSKKQPCKKNEINH